MIKYPDSAAQIIDADGMIGQISKNDFMSGKSLLYTRRTGGNQLLETFTDIVIRQKLGCLKEKDITRAQEATHRCERKRGLYDKNPPLPGGDRRNDTITFDDYIGISCGSAIVGRLPFQFDIVEYGVENGWIFDNNKDGRDSWTKMTKPWHEVLYRMNFGQRDFGWLDRFLFTRWIGDPKSQDDSGRRLRWLACEAIRNQTSPVPSFKDRAESYMRSLNLIGGINAVFVRMLGDWHPYSKSAVFT